MARTEIKALTDFIKASRNKPQSAIIREFLATIIKGKHISESGSVLVDRPLRQRLELFNDDGFLEKEDFLPKGKNWSQEFSYFDGIAGKAYRTKDIQVANNATQDADFSTRDGEVPIANMVCAPIPRGGAKRASPFGVASFHNATPARRFTDDDVVMIEAYTQVLALMLEISHLNLDRERSKRVFIAHGHDRLHRMQLEKLLLELNLEPVVMESEVKKGPEMLEMFDELVGGCNAGFILITPDDEGRSIKEDKLKPRARQNVIFESGALSSLFRAHKRICFLVKKGLELPSNMHGLACEEFAEELDEKRIERILKEWGLLC